MKKAAFHNLGCKVNAYETDAMLESLKNDGYEIVDFNEEADIYIINTCSVTNVADKKSRQMIHRAKKKNPNALIIACGCYVQTSKDEVIKDGTAHIVIGTNHKNKILDYIKDYYDGAEKIVNIDDISHEHQYEKITANQAGENTRAYMKIQDGCNQFCSYCIIPYARGRARSRSFEDIYEEAKVLASKKYKEIVLTGIHLSSYGKDTGDTLLHVIKELSCIEGIERIRLGSIEPGIISDEFLEEVSKIKEFCPHFHISMQSGCDSVLKRMNRHYTADEYYEKCCKIRKYFEHPAITTDVIVGFPMESEEEFNETYDFIKKVEFYETHVFKYSRRKGTKADKMEGQVKEEIKNERSDILLKENELKRKKFIEYYLDKEIEVLFEDTIEVDDKIYQLGHTKEYVKAALLSKENLSNTSKIGKAKGFLQNNILLLE
ncbi:threonylcarbamoyladenosine tRNA methylthiotransferase MtaB [Acetitomaculum ruminis DSM 5522]|uniref:Threonylcarbamoyladenosine tRNA methylthiotransferase MtaB n=1 Tax=Acetitomaculum ruminis DSM 5522 TaxID=1120918 RepID=A0A1I0ZK24_9FIRM|nr:tRNA (N(6)-L-threonylcarbamoyladenosine(37)-C(2))-methylthiotransferase MtaB [Acetitomaculum ruminis]SFB24748.1 threonylcarbamoyladenosine tRNA methylthiotransferase MtaB [Acetitomaculum ruminis DSM 5522]